MKLESAQTTGIELMRIGQLIAEEVEDYDGEDSDFYIKYKLEEAVRIASNELDIIRANE